ncbi:hypothetical protein JCM3770_005852 [Rhodotorula araucariae]
MPRRFGSESSTATYYSRTRPRAAAAKVAKKALPYNTLPLSFRLLRPLGAAHSSPCAVLVANLPIRKHGHLPIDEDLRDGVHSPTVEVFRLIDPEHREPFVSLGRLFLACLITPVDGILRFHLDRLEYSTELAGLAPVLDLWVTLRVARKVAAELGVLDELAALLESETRGAYSVEDKEEGGLVHNWKIGSDRIPPDEYSTHAMLSTTFPRIHLLAPGSQVRTLLPPFSSFPSYLERAVDQSGVSAEASLDALWSRLVEWSVLVHESYLDGADKPGPPRTEQRLPPRSSSPSPPSPFGGTGDLTPFFLFSTLAPLLEAHDLLPSLSPSVSASSSTRSLRTLEHLPSIPPLVGTALLPPPTSAPPALSAPAAPAPEAPTHAMLYLVDAIARLVMHAYHERAARAWALAPGVGPPQRARGRDGRLPPARGDVNGQVQGQGQSLVRAREGEEDGGGWTEPAGAGAVEWREAIEARMRVLEGQKCVADGGGAHALLVSGPRGLGTASSEADEGIKERLDRVEAQLAALQMAQRALARPSAATAAAAAMTLPAAGLDVVARAQQERERNKRLRTDAGALLSVFVLGLATGVGLLLRWR